MKAIHHKPKLRKVVATGFFILGIAGIILPILPGWIFIGTSLYLFSVDNPRIQGFIARHRFKHVAIDKMLQISYDRLHALYSIPKVIEPHIESQA